VDMVYGLALSDRPEPTSKFRQSHFPNATESVEAGCLISAHTPQTAKVYHCPDCIRAQGEWHASHPKRIR
jgi:hypothetical protein